MQDIVPIKLYEYLAMGKPVVTTRLPGIIKEFGEGNGVEYAKSADAIIDRVMELIEKENFGSEGKKSTRYAKSMKWDDLADIFQQVLYMEMSN